MAKSILVPGLVYPAEPGLSKQDVSYNASLYKIFPDGVETLIALGKANYDYSKKGVVVYPCYKIDDDYVTQRLGLYEILSSNETNVLDKDGDLDIEKLGPLVEYLGAKSSRPRLVRSWVDTFLKSQGYATQDNEGGGDCLFAAVRDGLQTVGDTVPVSTMRDLLAKEVTKELLEGYQVMYNQAKSEMLQSDAIRSNLKTEHSNLSKKGKSTKTAEDVQSLVEKGRELTESYKEALKNYNNAKELFDEYKVMEGIETVDDFRRLIKTCEFWGDTWAISTIERVLNVKLVLFSKQAYREGDKDNVLICGQINDSQIPSGGTFNPRYYILLEYSGDHYTLITYKGMGAFTFAELPAAVIDLIQAKCLEKAAGLYSLIPEFKGNAKSISPGEDKPTPVSVPVFQFYSKAAAKPKPGLGSGEKINGVDRTKFNALSSFKNWRRVLSLEHPHEFTAEGKRWKTGLHYYSYLLYNPVAPSFANQFSLDSKSELSSDTGLIKAAFSKQGRAGSKIVRPSEIPSVPNEDYDSDKLLKVQKAKFGSSEELKKLLSSTGDAILNEYRSRKPARKAIELMEVRKNLGTI